MPETISAVAFDMDGLMFNTEDTYWKTATQLLDKRGHKYTKEISEAIMGRPPKFCFEYMIKVLNLDDTWENMHRESEDLFLSLLDEGYSMMPGLLELLDFLEERNIPKCVCTSSTQRVAREAIGRYGLLDRFKFIISFDDVINGKPSPEIYEKAAKKFGIQPDMMLVLEDSASGCKSARDAGANVVAVLAHHNQGLDLSNAHKIVNRLDSPEILNYFH
ncbi:MAG: HAD family hydrolase [Thermoguttaceae bacterium]